MFTDEGRQTEAVMAQRLDRARKIRGVRFKHIKTTVECRTTWFLPRNPRSPQLRLTNEKSERFACRVLFRQELPL